MFLDELDCVDGKDLMTLDSTKWIHVMQLVMLAGFHHVFEMDLLAKQSGTKYFETIIQELGEMDLIIGSIIDRTYCNGLAEKFLARSF